MKKILFPTDFSEIAYNALEYAINIADFFDTELHILHVYEVKRPAGSIKSIREQIRLDSEKEMEKAMQFAEKAMVGKIILHARLIIGDTIKVICDIAEKENFDLIIMGTQGAGRLKAVFWGSNTSGVMTSSYVPILAIPNNCKYTPIHQIIFPADGNKVSDYEVLKPLLKIALAYKAKIKILHMGSEKEIKKFDNESLEFFFQKISHSYFTKAVTEGFNEVINQFTYDEKGDMICMIRRDRSLWESIFRKSSTSKEVFNAPVPLLILRSEL